MYDSKYKEVNCTDLSPSVRIPCSTYPFRAVEGLTKTEMSQQVLEAISEEMVSMSKKLFFRQLCLTMERPSPEPNICE
jgi:hypothetical protein